MSESSQAGVKRVDVACEGRAFQVWTRRMGENPRIKILLLHGGPGSTHTMYDCFNDYFPVEGFEYYFYDQLGSFCSDQPVDDDLWTIDRFVDEVEQVRSALGLAEGNFFLFGSSWGGMLALEYAFKHQHHLKGLIVSSAQASMRDYNRYANEVLAQSMDPKDLAEIRSLEAAEDFENPKYEELLAPFYTQFVLRMPKSEWPAAVTETMPRLNRHIYELMNGPSEFGMRGRLKDWDVKGDLHRIKVPTLVIGSTYNTMDPEQQKWMASEVQRGQYLHCPDGSHLAMWDDPEVFFSGLISFIREVDSAERRTT
ncbi:MAG: proline iminopeptidase-family hydrolase [Spirochaetales bacterium]|nr:proline iminopeptidase-family hydrolase [Spirochaetales bacterium]